MKKFMTYRKSNLIAALICVAMFLTIFIISLFITSINSVGKIALILFAGVSLVIIIVMVCKDNEIWSYVEISKNSICFKRYGRILQNYPLERINVFYSACNYKNSGVYPCLVITDKENVKISKMQNLRDEEYQKSNDYFIILLTKKRWGAVSSYFQNSIGIISTKELCDGVVTEKSVEKFYYLVEQHNSNFKG